MSTSSQIDRLNPGISLPDFLDALLRPERSKGSNRTNRTAANKRSPKKNGKYGKVLLFGQHRELALYRAEVLRHSGFSVIAPATRHESLEVIRRGDIDAVILSYTLSADMVEELTEMVRQYCSSCALITIAQGRTHDRRISPDAVVLAEDGPQALISTLRHVLGNHVQ